MPTNRIRYLIISIGIGLILLSILGTVIYLTRRSGHRVVNSNEHRIINSDSCPRPKNYKTNYDYDYTKRWREYRNINSSVDYFRFDLSWSPAYCNGKTHTKNSFQCQYPFGLIVHGLWPSKRTQTKNFHSSRLHPRNCRNEKELSIDIIDKYYCLMPSEDLMQTEWEKHGTCYWKKPEDYFEQIKLLYSKINFPNNINEILNNQTIPKHFKREYIKESFINLNPQLMPRYIDVMMIKKGKNLKSISFCYDLNFNHINCY